MNPKSPTIELFDGRPLATLSAPRVRLASGIDIQWWWQARPFFGRECGTFHTR